MSREANGGRTRRKRYFLVAPEPKDKRARPEKPAPGLETFISGPSSWSPVAAEALVAFDKIAALAVEGVPNLKELWAALEAAGESLSADTGAQALRRLPELLGASALEALGDEEALNAHLEKGAAVEAPPLPTAKGSEVANQAFLWLHGRIEATLDAAIQEIVPVPSLQWLATVAMFYGSLRPGPPLPRNILEDSADLALKQEDLEVPELGRVALGAALSGSLGRHKIYAKVAAEATALLSSEANCLHPSSVHDISLALSLVQPWDAETGKQVLLFREALVRSFLPKGGDVPVQKAEFLGACSVAGLRNGEAKENQDTWHAVVDGSVASVAIVDGHGRRGGDLSAAAKSSFAAALHRLKGGLGSAQELVEVILSVDAELLIHEKAEVEAELSGGTCIVMRIEGIGQAARRLAVAHLGDCRAVLGRIKSSNGSAHGSESQPSWTTLRLTEDHRPGEALEAARLISCGGRVQKMPGPAQVDPANLGPPRLWHRQRGQAPGLAMSRGLGDTLGKACGLSPKATSLDMELTLEDAVVVLGSDGVFDVLSDAEVLHCCRQFIEGKDATKAAEAVVASARRAWQQRGPYVDDCTCVVLFL